MTLQQFYNDYDAWLDAGAPEGQPFSRIQGLCRNLWDWSGYDNRLQAEMRVHLKKVGLNPAYPFGGDDVYDDESLNATMHLNPKRIQWVKDHANS